LACAARPPRERVGGAFRSVSSRGLLRLKAGRATTALPILPPRACAARANEHFPQVRVLAVNDARTGLLQTLFTSGEAFLNLALADQLRVPAVCQQWKSIG
jgi:hypothetical protein